MNHHGSLFIITILTIGFSSSKLSGFEGLDKTSQNFLKSYCIRCHDESKQKGNFRLDTLEVDFTNPIIAQSGMKWFSGSMPVKCRLKTKNNHPQQKLEI